MKFPKGNKVIYGQDFGWKVGIPHDIHFQVEFTGNLMRLTGPGYGIKNNYGNGPLHISLPTTVKEKCKCGYEKPEAGDFKDVSLAMLILQLELKKAEMAKVRDGLQDLYYECDTLLSDIDASDELLDEALEAMQRALDTLSQQV